METFLEGPKDEPPSNVLFLAAAGLTIGELMKLSSPSTATGVIQSSNVCTEDPDWWRNEVLVVLIVEKSAVHL